MRITFWGTRGSLPEAAPSTVRFGGNTPCVEVRGSNDDSLLVLDAGSGIRRLGEAAQRNRRHFDVLLTHLHLDHIQGLGFFWPLYDDRCEVNIWGPASTTMNLAARLSRYLAPPLFPVHLRDLPCHLSLHHTPRGTFLAGDFEVASDLVCHPGPTFGYRVMDQGKAITYLPDHEPFLGAPSTPDAPAWTSGYDLAAGADLLVHDAQYTSTEYSQRLGWGHSSIEDAIRFAVATGTRRLVAFHHDPDHDDEGLTAMFNEVQATVPPALEVSLAAEGESVDV